MKTKIHTLALAAVLAAFALAGCTQEARTQYDQAGDDLGQAAQKTGQAVATDADRTGDAAAKAAQNAGEAIDDATDKAQVAAEAGEMTVKVKNAILSAENLEAKDLNVDTHGKEVHLRGSVPTQEQKTRAESIAKNVAGKEFRIINELTVAGGAGMGTGGANTKGGG